MMIALYFLHGEPDDVSYVDSRTPEDRANEPEVTVTTTATDGPDQIVWLGSKAWGNPSNERIEKAEALGKCRPERRRRMPEHWVAREAILFVAGVVIGAWIVAAAVMWL